MSTNPQPDQPDSGPERFRQLFTMQMERPEEDLEMDRTALYLAGEEYPGLDVEATWALWTPWPRRSPPA